MECTICIQTKNKFFCNNCITESLIDYTNLKNNIEIYFPNMKEIIEANYNKKLNQLKVNYLKEQINQLRLLETELPKKITEAKSKNIELKSQNQERRLRIENLKTKLNGLVEQAKTGQETFLNKSKELDRDTQVRTGYTRKGLVYQLRSMVHFNPLESSITEQLGKLQISKENFKNKKGSNPAQESFMEISQTESPYFKFYYQFSGGVMHLIHVVNLASQYLGKLLPFSVVYRGSVPYLQHDFIHFQNISEIPLFLLDHNQDHHPLLLAISYYNLAYLCFTQSIILSASDYFNWPNHLQQLFKLCQHRVQQSNIAITQLSYQLDTNFKLEFKELLELVTKQFKGHQANSSLTMDKFLLDDYFNPDEDSSKGEDDPWDIVDVVLPPTPSELHAVGI